MLVGAATGLYPTLLPSSSDAGRDITIAKALSGPYATHVGLIWWSLGTLLAIGYFCVSYGMMRGRVSPQSDGYGH
jgi:cytochrome d ubiquinol oxidase subunit II